MKLSYYKAYILTYVTSRYLMASHLTDYKQPMLFLNTVAVLVLVVAKLPNMHKVRIFGINADI
jgi:hypothetical protein